jgi:hypothetical protein
MTIQLYIICFVVAILGMALQTILKLRSIKTKAALANVSFNPLTYFKEDWLSIAASLITIILTLFFVSEILNWNALVINYVKIGFAFVGYTGSDIMSRLFSVVNARINSAIDYKTTIADTATGTLDKPTPAK